MNDLTAAIGKELESCTELLGVFQQERQLYCGSATIGIPEVTAILAHKQQLVEIFDRQHFLMKELREKNGACSPAEQNATRDLMRRLGAVLEQLLVIDHENEKLLRENISSRRLSNVSVPNHAPSRVESKIRPALQRQMPFIPGMRSAAPPPEAPAVVPAKATAAVAAARVAATTEIPVPETQERSTAKHLLRKYIQAGQMSGLSSKYA